jgi:hypothetical protein
MTSDLLPPSCSDKCHGVQGETSVDFFVSPCGHESYLAVRMASKIGDANRGRAIHPMRWAIATASWGRNRYSAVGAGVRRLSHARAGVRALIARTRAPSLRTLELRRFARWWPRLHAAVSVGVRGWCRPDLLTLTSSSPGLLASLNRFLVRRR